MKSGDEDQVKSNPERVEPLQGSDRERQYPNTGLPPGVILVEPLRGWVIAGSTGVNV